MRAIPSIHVVVGFALLFAVSSVLAEAGVVYRNGLNLTAMNLTGAKALIKLACASRCLHLNLSLNLPRYTGVSCVKRIVDLTTVYIVFDPPSSVLTSLKN